MSRARTSRSNTAGRDDQIERLPALAADLVRRRVAVIVATGRPCAGSLRPRLRPHDSDRLHDRE